MTKSILVLAAHPDDEVLGIGGTIACHAAMGDRVHIVIAAEGATSRDDKRDIQAHREEIDELKSASRNASNILGASSVSFLDLPDNRCDSIDRLDLTKKIESIIIELKPQIVYVHHCGDLNIDHRILHEVTFTACRPQPGHTVKRILSYETASSTEWASPASMMPFVPNFYIDIDAYWHQKKAALDAYQQEMKAWPHARSITAVEYLGRWRGASVGVGMAEAFMLLREIFNA